LNLKRLLSIATLPVLPHIAASREPITFAHNNDTFGSLTFWVFADKLRAAVLRCGRRGEGVLRGCDMRFLYVCYAAVGYAVARWLFKREPTPVKDPVSRLRTSGLL
jgi:hypothetical protein